MTQEFYPLQNNDIVTKTEGNRQNSEDRYSHYFFGLESEHSFTYRSSEIVSAIAKILQSARSSYTTEMKLLSDGVECELMKNTGGGWKKGKFRLKMSLEFCPDEPEEQQNESPGQPESVLDDIRKSLKDVSQ
ncbi:MAG: KGK domain-containing protein [Cyanobacteria bacterium P01_E01_bin.42]